MRAERLRYNRDVIATQLRCSTGAVQLRALPRPAQVAAMPRYDDPQCQRLLTVLRALVAQGACLPAGADLADMADLPAAADAVLLLGVLRDSGHLRLMEGEGKRFPGARVVWLSGGGELRSAGCPVWWRMEA